MRQCKIYRCSKQPGAPCCIDCSEEDCAHRCLNHPERCSCWCDTIVRKQGQRKDVFDHHQIISLRASGMSVDDIADVVGCSRGTVLSHMARERKRSQ